MLCVILCFSEPGQWPKARIQHNDTYTYYRQATFNLIVESHSLPFVLTDLPIDAPDRRRLPPLLRRAWYGLNQAFRRRIAHLDLTPDQFTVMRILLEASSEEMTQRQLTQLMSSDPNTIASLLKRMEQAGLIGRKSHERDRRAHKIYLKTSGKRKYVQAREIAVALQTEVLNVLPTERREAFLRDLADVAEACRSAAATAVPQRNSS